MPKIRRQELPPALLNHLLDRVAEREISANQLGQFADWLATDPEVPEGGWFKRFPEMLSAEKVRWLRHSCGPGRLRLARKWYKFVSTGRRKSERHDIA
jgi:hypothetical protein